MAELQLKQGAVYVVIVNYRTADLVIDCLRSLSTQVADLRGGRVVVVDNASGDGSVEKLRVTIGHEGWSSWTDILPLDRNGGFSFGNNAGIQKALSSSDMADYLMLLNPDTVIRPRAVKALTSFMESHPQAGIVGSQLENIHGGLDLSAHTFPSPLSELDTGLRGMLGRFLYRYAVTSVPQDAARLCDWVSGASMMIRRQVVEGIGRMDEDFFLYFEEVDFCRRAQSGGWECWYVPESCVVHLEGASTGIRVSSKRRAKYWFDSRRRFFVKHYGIAGLIVADLLRLSGHLLYLPRKILYFCLSRENSDPKWFMLDLLWGDVSAILTGRVRRISRASRRK